MKKYPRISIVTPSYNQAKYLPETIESVISQGYPNLEYIIIDGGSNDGSIDIIKRYQKYLHYWCSGRDEGQSDAIMKGINHCSGELFAWVNSDDVLFPGCLKAIADCYVSNFEPDIIHTDVAYINSIGKITRLIKVPKQSRFFFFRGVWHGCAPSIFFKKATLLRVGGINKEYHLSMDLDLWMRILRDDGKIGHVAKYCGGFRWHNDAKTVKSLAIRENQENHETSAIWAKYYTESTMQMRRLWRIVYKVYQIVNFNYFISIKDYALVKRKKHWKQF